jgi:hypothetical protein
MNSNCIHMRDKSEYIYVQDGENIQIIHWRNTIIEMPNTYLIPLSNSCWINNTEFGEIKLMMVTSLSLHEEICQLKL